MPRDVYFQILIDNMLLYLMQLSPFRSYRKSRSLLRAIVEVAREQGREEGIIHLERYGEPL